MSFPATRRRRALRKCDAPHGVPICVALDRRGVVADVAHEKWLRLLLVACREAVADARDSLAPGRRALVPGLEELCAEFHARVLELEATSVAATSRPYGR